MRIFHLADLHLGKTLYERDLIDDQRHALSAVVEAARAERPACVVLAGDVFDRAVPSAEAVTLLGEFAAALKAADPELAVAMIPGNHDSAARLAYLSPVLAMAGVHIAADPGACVRPVVVERGGERLRLWLLPFLTPGAFAGPPAAEAAPADGSPAPIDGAPAIPAAAPSASSAAARPAVPAGRQRELFADESADAEQAAEPAGDGPADDGPADDEPALRSQADLFAEATRRIGDAMARARAADGDGRAADVLVCHAFAAGGEASESERVFLGSAELVDASAFSAFDYAALGHLHRPQSAGANGRYPGSLLSYSFSEAGAERGFLSVDVSPGGFSAEFRPVRPLRRMVRVSGSFDEVLSDPRYDRYADDYVEATLSDATAVLNPMDALRRRFPFIMSLRQAAFERVADEAAAREPGRPAASLADDFAAFHREMTGSDPDDATAALFAELYEEARREAP
ncbi:MAG: exonuclease SbcCD subunit D [Spirochaetaceae bacterium]|nr:exonuclease SbcCD subunit D [Spirochaetaceae bacterium]